MFIEVQHRFRVESKINRNGRKGCYFEYMMPDVRKWSGRGDVLMILAVLIALFYHGASIMVTYHQTFDAYVHMFFGDHYARSWFDTWEPKWYTGFPTLSYPPLVHQIIGVVSTVFNLETGFCLWAVLMIALFVFGTYRFSLLLVDEFSAGIAALLAVFSSTLVETIHVFGQLPTLTGLAFLLNALPEIYQYVRNGGRFHLLAGLSLLSVVTASHHVTTIFGMVFFVAPVFSIAVIDGLKEKNLTVNVKNLMAQLLTGWKPIVLFSVTTIVLTLLVLFPYWYWSKTDPISQVSIHHASRDSFIENPAAGMVFFLIPWGMFLFLIPFLFHSILRVRTIFLGLSFCLLVLLGTGGTTPLPRMILGKSAFEILTLDRFTTWATIMILPFAGRVVKDILFGSVREFMESRWGKWGHRIPVVLLFTGVFVFSVFTTHLSAFRPMQPAAIDMQPIVNFIEKDKHDRWRYLTLGFGDQMAKLSTKTDALTVDGNYHSARRLPELTSRAVERLENSKFSGIAGLGSLQQFLTISDKYHLKYIFSNDKFYDPLLHFYGWQRVQRLENSIVVWEKPDIIPLPSVLPRKVTPRYQNMMWGILPPMTLVLCIVICVFYAMRRKIRMHKPMRDFYSPEEVDEHPFSKKLMGIQSIWFVVILVLYGIFMSFSYYENLPQQTPEQTLRTYYDAIDFKYFDKARKLFHPESRPSKEQYALNRSTSDGILASYGKLQDISIQRLESGSSEDTILMSVRSTWITPIKEYTLVEEFQLGKVNSKWFILYDKQPEVRPPDQFFSRKSVVYKDHGRRTLNTEITLQEDILDRPELQIHEANLVYRDSAYHVVGLLQNTDNYPAYITAEAALYDSAGNELTRYTAGNVIKHKLSPKESTPFRIDFEEISWRKTGDKVPTTFNPNEFNKAEVSAVPSSFKVFVKSMVTDNDLYTSLAFDRIKFDSLSETLDGYLYNYGTLEVAVPQLLIATYKEGELIWVKDQYIRYNVRPQHRTYFRARSLSTPKVFIVHSGNKSDMLVNGLPQGEFGYSFGPRTDISGNLKLKANRFEVQLFLNPYIPFVVQ